MSEGSVGRRAVRLVGPWLLMTGRVLATIVILLVVYYQVPVRSGSVTSDLPFLLLNLVLFTVIVGVQIPLILRARHPVLRSAEAMGLTVCLYLVMFARIYLSISVANPAAFNQPLDHSTALYFTVTVFATVGFGDVVAVANATKLVVTVQMVLNLIVLGVVVRLLITAGQRARSRQQLAG